MSSSSQQRLNLLHIHIMLFRRSQACNARVGQRPSLSRGRVAAAAARYTSAPLPASFANTPRRTSDNSILASISARQAQWSNAGSGPGLPQTVLLHVSHLAEQAVEVAEKPVVTAVETAVGGAQAAQGAVTGFVSHVLAHFAALVARIQAALVQLLTFRRNEQFKLRTGTHAGAGAADVAGTRTPVAFVAPSSGTRRAVAGGSQQQQLMLVPGQRSAFSQVRFHAYIRRCAVLGLMAALMGSIDTGCPKRSPSALD